MGSTRLPGKVLLELSGKSVLAHVLERCRAIRGVDVVICATVDSPDCDAIVQEAQRAHVEIFRGAESDVLGRYFQAARLVGAERILRVTSDCPLIDPEVCAATLALLDDDVDFASNNEPVTWPHGLDCEAFPSAWLRRAAHEATDPLQREHVGSWMRHHPMARKANLECPAGHLSHLRWTLDTADDFAFLRQVFPLLTPGAAGWSWHHTLAAIRSNPELSAVKHRRPA